MSKLSLKVNPRIVMASIQLRDMSQLSRSVGGLTSQQEIK
jgi:hypothetical protein